MQKPILLVAVAVLGALLLWLLLFWDPVADQSSGHRSLELAAEPVGGEFELQSPDGTIALSDLRGQVVLLYFGYTACPDICPTNLAITALAYRGLTRRERAQVQVLFVSVDPGRDTPERLSEYVAYFHPDFIGLTGSEQRLAAVAQRYGAAFRRSHQPDSAMGYMVDHSASSYIIDPTGALVEILDHATPAEEIQARIRGHLPRRSPDGDD